MSPIVISRHTSIQLAPRCDASHPQNVPLQHHDLTCASLKEKIIIETEGLAGLADHTACGKNSRCSGGVGLGLSTCPTCAWVRVPLLHLRTCDNSPIWTSLTALDTRRSTSPVRSRRLLLALGLLNTWDALEHQRLPLSWFETSKTFFQSFSWIQSTARKSVQQHSWNQEEQHPCFAFWCPRAPERQCTPHMKL